MEFGQLVSSENQQARFKTFSILKVIYTGCSMKGPMLLLFQWWTKSFQNKFFSSAMWVASNKLKCALRILILCSLKILCTVYTAKEATSLFLSGISKSFLKRWLLYMHFEWIVATQNKKLNSGHYTFGKCYIQGAQRKKKHHSFLPRAPKISRINAFYTYTLAK